MPRFPARAALSALLVASAAFVVPQESRAQARPEAFDPTGGSLGPGREITIELDTAQGRNADRSLGLALLGSALLPGAGELYLGEEASGKSFLLAEAGFWASLFIAWQARESYVQSARNHAAQYAGSPETDPLGRMPCEGRGESCLELLASYRAYRIREHRQDSYELAQTLSDRELRDMPDWDFGSSNTPENTRRWQEYQSVMRHYRGAKVAISFAAGALILNRAASMAHTLRAYRRTSGKGLGMHYRLDPEFFPDGSGVRLTLGF